MVDPQEQFIAGYLAAMKDINGALTMTRAKIMWADPEGAARQCLADPDWLTPLVEEADRTAPVAPSSFEQAMGMIYVLHDLDRQMVKIGWTAGNVDRRLRAIEKASGTSLSLVKCWAGTMAEEKALHARYADSRVNGEWFTLDSTLYDLIA